MWKGLLSLISVCNDKNYKQYILKYYHLYCYQGCLKQYGGPVLILKINH